MRDFFIIAFILSLPVLAVFGHDAYMAYTNTELQGIDRFYPSDLGWLWVQYAPDSYNWMVENTDSILWNSFIDPLLQQSALLVAAAPVAIFIAITLLMKIFGFGSFAGEGVLRFGMGGGTKKKGGGFSFSGKEGSRKSKYKRK